MLGLDWGESRASVIDFVERYAIAYPILLDPTLDNFYRWSARSGCRGTTSSTEMGLLCAR